MLSSSTVKFKTDNPLPLYPAWTIGIFLPEISFSINPSINLWLLDDITASISFAFFAISAASPIIILSSSFSEGKFVNAIIISAPLSLTSSEYLFNESKASKTFNPLIFPNFSFFKIPSVTIPINATFMFSTSSITYGTAYSGTLPV